MEIIRRPGIFLAQFTGEHPPFNTLEGMAKWAAGQGYKALQIPCNRKSLFNVEQAAISQTCCDDIRGMLTGHGLVASKLSIHLEGQLIVVHPIYDDASGGSAPPPVHANPQARQAQAIETLHQITTASQGLGLTAHATFLGSLAWPLFYP